MKNFMITTDTTCDLPRDYVTEHKIGMMSLTYTFDDTTYCWDNPLPLTDFYQKMREGSLPTTAQVNPAEAKRIFKEMLDAYDCDIIHLAFSSAMSGSFNSARIAAEELMEEGIRHKIFVIDTLCASAGLGLLIHRALNLQEEGKNAEEAAAWLEENKLNVVHTLTVDDLHHLYRGGRLSKTSAVLGSIVNVKPLIYITDEGSLLSSSNVRGRKKSLNALIDNMEKCMGSWRGKNDLVCITHGDCEEDANYMADVIRERFGIENFMIYPIGPIIGCHVGPGAIILAHMGDTRGFL